MEKGTLTSPILCLKQKGKLGSVNHIISPNLWGTCMLVRLSRCMES